MRKDRRESRSEANAAQEFGLPTCQQVKNSTKYVQAPCNMGESIPDATSGSLPHQ